MKRNTLLNWREKLGLSQQALADYLMISRGLVNLVERGERELPTQALLELSQLISNHAVATPANLSPERTLQERRKCLEWLNSMIKESTWQLAKLNRELTLMEADHQQALHHIQAFQMRQQQLATHVNHPPNERQQLWLSIQEEEAWKKVEKNNSVSRIPLQLKIVALQATLREAQQLIHSLGD
ncbi:MAG: helix-turn-helix transcriptional regulator [Bacteroidota bacterium]